MDLTVEVSLLNKTKKQKYLLWNLFFAVEFPKCSCKVRSSTTLKKTRELFFWLRPMTSFLLSETPWKEFPSLISCVVESPKLSCEVRNCTTLRKIHQAHFNLNQWLPLKIFFQKPHDLEGVCVSWKNMRTHQLWLYPNLQLIKPPFPSPNRMA